MAITRPTRQDQYDVTASVTYGGTTHDLGTFDTFSGGEADSEETKYNPGGLAEQLSLGGRRTVGNVTVGRIYDLARDHPLMGWLLAVAGRADLTVVKTPLNPDGVAVPSPLVYRGKLKAVSPPEHDSNSNDAATWEMELSSASVSQ